MIRILVLQNSDHDSGRWLQRLMLPNSAVFKLWCAKLVNFMLKLTQAPSRAFRMVSCCCPWLCLHSLRWPRWRREAGGYVESTSSSAGSFELTSSAGPACIRPVIAGTDNASLPSAEVDIVKCPLSSAVVQYSAFDRTSRLPLSWGAVLDRLAKLDPVLCTELHQALCSCPFQDFFWECSPVSHSSLDKPFQFVMIDAGGSLRRRTASPSDFHQHLATAESRGRLATAFSNLGNDAKLIAPTQHPGTATAVYGHLASFVDAAPAGQQSELWRIMAKEIQHALEVTPERMLWVNTDGRGVPWLHVRLDQQPKYIKHRAFLLPQAGHRAACPDVVVDSFATHAHRGHSLPSGCATRGGSLL